jgi:hypothetical protein
MLSISSLNSISSLDQTSALQGFGSSQSTSSAKDAFAALFQQVLAGQSQAQTTTSAASTTGQNSVASDMAALGQALNSGNLSSPQQAFQSLQTALQGAQKGHHHHHHHPAGDGRQTGSTASQSDITLQISASTSGSSTSGGDDSQVLNLLLDLGQTGN